MRPASYPIETRRARTRRYHVASAAEETQCRWCGYPLLVGDVAFEVPGDDLSGYCSDLCARRDVRMINELASREDAHRRRVRD
jgi:hypothetical protein